VMLCEVAIDVPDSMFVYVPETVPYLTRLLLFSSVSHVIVTEFVVGVVFAILLMTGGVVSVCGWL